MKKWFACTSILILSALLTLVFAQRRGAGRSAQPAEALKAKRESIAGRDERMRRLMSSAGVGVEDAALLAATGDASRSLKISLTDPSRKGSNAAPLRAEQLSSQVGAALLGESRVRGAAPRQRSLELSPEHVLLATVNAKSQLRWWSLMPDPRVLRSEGPGPDGTLTGVVLYRPEAEFVVNIPSDDEASELRFYHPLWTGEEFTLQLLGAIRLRNN